MRNITATIISILAFGGVYFAFNVTANATGIPLFRDMEFDSYTTDFGMYAFIVSVMLAWRVYHWVLSGGIAGNISIESHITWVYWLVGMTIYILLIIPLSYIEMPALLHRMIILICAVGLILLGLRQYRITISKCQHEKITPNNEAQDEGSLGSGLAL